MDNNQSVDYFAAYSQRRDNISQWLSIFYILYTLYTTSRYWIAIGLKSSSRIAINNQPPHNESILNGSKLLQSNQIVAPLLPLARIWRSASNNASMFGISSQAIRQIKPQPWNVSRSNQHVKFPRVSHRTQSALTWTSKISKLQRWHLPRPPDSNLHVWVASP